MSDCSFRLLFIQLIGYQFRPTAVSGSIRNATSTARSIDIALHGASNSQGKLSNNNRKGCLHQIPPELGHVAGWTPQGAMDSSFIQDWRRAVEWVDSMILGEFSSSSTISGDRSILIPKINLIWWTDPGSMTHYPLHKYLLYTARGQGALAQTDSVYWAIDHVLDRLDHMHAPIDNRLNNAQKLCKGSTDISLPRWIYRVRTLIIDFQDFRQGDRFILKRTDSDSGPTWSRDEDHLIKKHSLASLLTYLL